MKKSVALLSLAVAVKLVSQGALAKVSEEEAARLGNELTCTGAERAANADGSIPAFTGKYLGEVPGWDHVKHSGGKPVDPYPNEKPILVITAQNVEEHAKHLTEGQKAMFRKYPDTFRMDIYPGHRDYRYPDYVCERAKWNALNAEVVNDGMGVEGIGQVMFPIPKNGYELLWNHQLPARAWTEDAVRDLASVMPDGNIGWGRTHMKGLSPANHPTETPYTKTGVQAYSYNYTMLPTRDRGTAIAAHEPYNFTTSTRTAWSYNPGTRRVRQSPGYGYDQPMAGSNGTMIVDEDRLFNGGPERFEWKMLGKREIYIPANAYKINSADTKYADLLTPHHPNPDFQRYELRRVWVLEATLKEGYRHVYGKRVMFIDEVTWHGVLADHYDTRGQLWKYASTSYYYHPDMSAWQSGAAFYHDLSTGQYLAYALTNESHKGPILNEGKFTPNMYTPDALRAAGR